MAPTQQPTVEERSSSDTTASSIKSPRMARFVEATTVQSPTGPADTSRSPFADPPGQSQTHPDVSDVGFGYVAANDSVQHVSYHQLPVSPLKSALKVPGTPGRTLNPLSPTFREEFYVEKEEKSAEKENARDLRIKLRVRVAKIFLRFVNFGCSLIVVTILALTLFVFHSTKSLPSRGGFPAWANGTNPWTQYLLLSVACVSLFACLIVFWGYWKGGHKRAEKLTVYYQTIAVCFFMFSLVMWIVAAALYQNEKANGNSQDLWGWSCKKNTRETLFHNDIDYALLCRLQDWGLVCAIIEVVLEVLVILIYAVVFYRFWTKRRLMKSMDRRDKARSDLYLAQLRLQSAPNTPGFSLSQKTPIISTTVPQDPYSMAENGEACSTQFATPRSPTKPQPTFQLQAPPIRVQQATPKTDQMEFLGPISVPTASGPASNVNQHMAAAPGERTYDAVPIPNAYSSPMSPTFPRASR
ncbi:hamH [Aspergillus flavus]|uniref:HamH n=1 Tax=Aspergillus flavus (strain ATCC 200026 / FGSC A1120 / IAM 13836 / NRRL 3357 / JCM 12722 / SRRC 167) TaxID=332952 RepID=A0A7U2MLY5_ASPFN|nr:uncharacterized protein G4B84_005101 [Aspergillus flavus NRRL3357]KAF7620146.1 hypothetical protein AFLA_005459 [Aspergillus flavus NRRL3357]QMW29766.1 hypothetical protein G4B84_005101 [Aspergillus flavus NRRL3357]QRD86160.1 hamH [Aspergillus flavus]